MEKTIIKLLPIHRGKQSSTFTGRPQGIQIRNLLNLDDKDKTQEDYIIEIPEGTSSFNPSFFLGMFFDSIKHLNGLDNFYGKYEIHILESNNDVKSGLEYDLLECKRQALNEFHQVTGLDI